MSDSAYIRTNEFPSDWLRSTQIVNDCRNLDINPTWRLVSHIGPLSHCARWISVDVTRTFQKELHRNLNYHLNFHSLFCSSTICSFPLGVAAVSFELVVLTYGKFMRNPISHRLHWTRHKVDPVCWVIMLYYVFI